MVPVNLVSLLATLLVVWLVFARDIPRDYALEGLESPQSAVKDPLVFRLTLPLLVVLLLAYFVTSPLGVPVSVVTGVAAVLLMVVAGLWWHGGRDAPVLVLKGLQGAARQIVVFSLGMDVVG